jgi:hypothetical protein
MRFVKTLPPKASLKGNNRTTVESREQQQKNAERLRARPGQWALLRVTDNGNAASSQAAHINRGGQLAYRPKGAFEAVCRKVDGQARVYIRYVGEGQ